MALPSLVQEHGWFCVSHFAEVIEMLLSHKNPEDAASSRSRFACLHVLMAHGIQVSFFYFCINYNLISVNIHCLSIPILCFIRCLNHSCLMKTISDILMFFFFFAVKRRGGE